MSKEGANLTCTDCHTTVNHEMSGRYYTKRALLNRQATALGSHLSCESCHGATPHKNSAKLNDHTDKVSCQACHIPGFARSSVSTLMSWDWSTAGKFTADKKPITKKDTDGNPIYNTMKGDMVWGKNVTPIYAWYNGAMKYTTMKDTLPASRPVEINQPLGDYNDPEARIFPFKYFQGRQVYDAETNRFVISKLFGPKGSGAYWSDYNWQKSVEVGMAESGEKFSGKIDFVDTAMYWPVTHMVAPKENSLQCAACHARNGRLASVAGFYLPGRDRVKWLDIIGWSLFILSIIGVLAHGFGRLIFRLKRSK